MSKFDELEERIFDAPVVTLPHDAYTCGSTPPASQHQYGKLFHYHYDQNHRCLKPIGPI
jgi:hypothetical protein